MIDPCAVLRSLQVSIHSVIEESLVLPVDLFVPDRKAVFPGKEIMVSLLGSLISKRVSAPKAL